MISKDSLTKEWLDEVSKKNNKADKILIEKVIRALLLLEGLVQSDLKFVFKGGTSLMLLLNSTKRLSIDIDIIVSKAQNLDEGFSSFFQAFGFTRFEEQHREKNSDIEKAHYKFFYNHLHKTFEGEDYVLLDVLFEEPHYTNIQQCPIDSSFVIQDGEPLNVLVPSVEDILGDKLTAFAPNTTGIPYEKNGDSRAMEIIKQLFDIGSLIEVVEDIPVIASTFDLFAKTEIGYRKCETDSDGVLDDIYNTALHICSLGKDGKGNYQALSQGIVQVKRFIFSSHYHLESAITDAAKTAYISTILKYKYETMERYKNPEQVKDLIIGQHFNTKLNKLKKRNPEAFFYWHEISLIRS